MFLHEFQAKELLQEKGVESPFFVIVPSVEEGMKAYEKWTNGKIVLKVQVHAGGRKKGGGVRIAEGKEEVKKILEEMLQTSFQGAQTGGKELLVQYVMMTSFISLKEEFYVSLAFDRTKKGVFFTFSKEGGIDIEEKEKSFLNLKISPNRKLEEEEIRTITDFLQIPYEKEALHQFLAGLIETYYSFDAEMIEINPLGKDEKGKLWAIDAKMTVDDAALFRQKKVASFFDPSQEEETVLAAKKLDLAFVPLKGSIGCLVNGAGLALATLDLIEEAGFKAANFLDVGGSASVEKIAEGFLLILEDSSVKKLFVNIFGGIMDCETIAKGLLLGKKKREEKTAKEFTLPVILRMEGNHVEKGLQILNENHFSYVFVQDLKEAFYVFSKELV